MRVSIPNSSLATAGIVSILLAGSGMTSDVEAADSPEEIGLEVATETRERQRGFENFVANLTMVLRNKSGRKAGGSSD